QSRWYISTYFAPLFSARPSPPALPLDRCRASPVRCHLQSSSGSFQSPRPPEQSAATCSISPTASHWLVHKSTSTLRHQLPSQIATVSLSFGAFTLGTMSSSSASLRTALHISPSTFPLAKVSSSKEDSVVGAISSCNTDWICRRLTRPYESAK